MKKFLSIGLIVIMALAFTACTAKTPSAEREQAAATAQILDNINNEVGMPNLTNFQQKKLMKSVFELCDRADLICYAYLQSEMTGQFVYIGRCLGYGVPFSAQYTNPEKVNRIQGGAIYTSPQADPNGLYMPTSSSATWLVMFNEDNEPWPVFFEPEITVSPFPLRFGVLNPEDIEREDVE